MPELDPVPILPEISESPRLNEAVKAATPDLIIFNDETLPVDVISDLLFEEIGGRELINIVRSDSVLGQSAYYRPIKNLKTLATKYGPKTLISLQDPSNVLFDNFAIKFENYTPSSGTGVAGEWVYIDPSTGSLIIDIVNVVDGEEVEVQILASGARENVIIATGED